MSGRVRTLKKKIKNEVKMKKKKESKRLKKRIHLNVSPEIYEFVRQKGLNASRFVENALKRLKLGLGEDFKTESADLVLISQNNPENSLKEWIRRDSNPRTPPCEGDVIPLDHESNQKGKKCTDRESNPGYWLGRPKSYL